MFECKETATEISVQRSQLYENVIKEASVRKWSSCLTADGRMCTMSSDRPSVVTVELKGRIEASTLQSRLSLQ